MSITKAGHVPLKIGKKSFITSLYKGAKGKAMPLRKKNCRGHKLLDQVMKVLEWVTDDLISKMVKIDDMHFGFMPRWGTIDAIFIIRLLHKECLPASKELYCTFVEWLTQLVQSMCYNAHSSPPPPSFVATWAIWSRQVAEGSNLRGIMSEYCCPSCLPAYVHYHYNRVMIRWTCYVRHDQIAISDDFLNKLKIPELETGLRTNRLG